MVALPPHTLLLLFNQWEKMDLDGVSCPSHMATSITLPQVCTATKFSQVFFSIIFYEYLVKFVEKDSGRMCSSSQFL